MNEVVKKKSEGNQLDVIPLKNRPLDIIILLFFWFNILFVTYIIDLEQNVIADPENFEYPIWPPKIAVDIIHEYGKNYDPLQYARPVWWRMTIWIDSLFFGPFYIAAIYAYTKGREWIRIPSFLYSSSLITIVIIILGEETLGPHSSSKLLIVYLLNLPWIVVPILIIFRMWRVQEGLAFHRLDSEEILKSTFRN